MKCLECGGRMAVRRENHRYDACGLAGVTLLRVEVARCPDCGEYEVMIPAIEQLHRKIAWTVVEKRARLAPAEIRYLRKYLGLSGADFAAHMGTRPETVSRWENGTAQMGPVADRLLRAMVVIKEPVKEYSIETLRTVARAAGAPVRVQLRKAGQRAWAVA
jgi:putative zinc finger/helix-turn-helix YgiT family protein